MKKSKGAPDMRRTLAVVAMLGATIPLASYAAAPIRPVVESYAIKTTPLVMAGARVGAPMTKESHVVGTSYLLIGILAAGAVGAGVYAGVHNSHAHASSPVSPQ